MRDLASFHRAGAIGVLAGCLAGCAVHGPVTKPPPMTTPGATTAVPSGRALSPIPVEAVREPEPPPKSLPMEVPAGTVCAVHGSGAPAADPCKPSWIEVTSDAEGKLPLARLDARSADVTWGFVPGTRRVWVGLRGEGAELRGYATNQMIFELQHAVEAVPGHVWLDPGATVKAALDASGKLEVKLAGDLPGSETVVGTAPCDELSYEPFTTFVARPLPFHAKPAETTATAKHGMLTVFYEPGGKPQATLRSRDKSSIFFDVYERLGTYARVELTTDHALFDVWIQASAIDEAAAGDLFGSAMGSSCAGWGDEMSSENEMVTLTEDTPVLVTGDPHQRAVPGIVAKQGQSLLVKGHRKGYVEVEVPLPVIPPRGRAFWIPESALVLPDLDETANR